MTTIPEQARALADNMERAFAVYSDSALGKRLINDAVRILRILSTMAEEKSK